MSSRSNPGQEARWVAHGWSFYHDAAAAGLEKTLGDLYSAREIALFKTIDQSPQAQAAMRQFLDLEVRTEAQPAIGMPTGRELPYNPADIWLEGLAITSGSLGGAIGMFLAQHAYPDDPVLQNKAAQLLGNLIDAGLAAGEALGAGHKQTGWHPGVHEKLHGDTGPDRPWQGREPAGLGPDAHTPMGLGKLPPETPFTDGLDPGFDLPPDPSGDIHGFDPGMSIDPSITGDPGMSIDPSITGDPGMSIDPSITGDPGMSID
ncbi:hypothetical protein ABTY61_38690, partial [Kitasatospora sp. NPDC096128]